MVGSMHGLCMNKSYSLPGRLRERFLTQGDSIALVAGAAQVTYAELHAMTILARAYIGKLGLSRTDPIAVQAAKSPGTIALIAACLEDHRPFLLPSAKLGFDALSEILAQACCGDLLTASPANENAPVLVLHVDCTAK